METALKVAGFFTDEVRAIGLSVESVLVGDSDLGLAPSLSTASTSALDVFSIFYHHRQHLSVAPHSKIHPLLLYQTGPKTWCC